MNDTNPDQQRKNTAGSQPAPVSRRLKILANTDEYIGVNKDDPIRFYQLPVIGSLYRQRIELCLSELTGGEKILEVGFGSGVTFFNLSDLYQEIHGVDLTANVEEIQSFFKKKNIRTQLKQGSLLELPYPDGCFDAVLLISILEHLKPIELDRAFTEIFRVIKPGGQVVYGVPVERPFMSAMFRLLGYDIHKHHFSTEKDVFQAASKYLQPARLQSLTYFWGLTGKLYEVGHFKKG